MSFKKSLTTAILLSSALAASSAFAGTSKKDIDAYKKTTISMPSAIKAAESASGGKAIDASFDETNKGGSYKVTVVLNDKTDHYIVDAMMSKAVASQDKSLLAKVEMESKTERTALKAALVSLPAAISKAEASQGGKVIDAELETHNKLAYYDISLVKDGMIIKASVDGDTGTVTKK